MTGTRTYSRGMYSKNRLNMNRIPYVLPRSAYSTCRVVVVVVASAAAPEAVVVVVVVARSP